MFKNNLTVVRWPRQPFPRMEIVVARPKIRRCVCADCKRKVSQTREYHQSINRVMTELDERSRRLFAGLLARQLGRGGITCVQEITGLSRVTIRRGLNECETGQTVVGDRIQEA